MVDKFYYVSSIEPTCFFFDQLKVNYRAQKDKWNIDELITICVQEKVRLKFVRLKAHIWRFIPNLSQNLLRKTSNLKRSRKMEKNSECRLSSLKKLVYVTFVRRQVIIRKNILDSKPG